MSTDERVRLFDWMTKLERFNSSIANGEAESLRFYARFDQSNQYRITATDNQIYDCYRFENRYWLSRTKFIPEEMVRKVTRVDETPED